LQKETLKNVQTKIAREDCTTKIEDREDKYKEELVEKKLIVEPLLAYPSPLLHWELKSPTFNADWSDDDLCGCFLSLIFHDELVQHANVHARRKRGEQAGGR
jgi:hypothetical protein